MLIFVKGLDKKFMIFFLSCRTGSCTLARGGGAESTGEAKQPASPGPHTAATAGPRPGAV